MMNKTILVVGAGASVAEASAAHLSTELTPPLVTNFASRLWPPGEFYPHDLIVAFFAQNGIACSPGRVRERFIELEADRSKGINVETLFAFAYQNQTLPFRSRVAVEDNYYENLLQHGVIRPLCFLLLQGLLKDPISPVLPEAESMARVLRPNDFVLNLNYDTLFEIGARNVGHELGFVTTSADVRGLRIAKPHGSINMFTKRGGVDPWFSDTLFNTLQPSTGGRNYLGIVPPRLGKSYEQHPAAAMIFENARRVTAERVVFWGTSITESDKDLLGVYRDWCNRAERVAFVNPSTDDHARAQLLLGTDIERFDFASDWAASQSG